MPKEVDDGEMGRVWCVLELYAALLYAMRGCGELDRRGEVERPVAPVSLSMEDPNIAVSVERPVASGACT